jgi:hypothetical protein
MAHCYPLVYQVLKYTIILYYYDTIISIYYLPHKALPILKQTLTPCSGYCSCYSACFEDLSS